MELHGGNIYKLAREKGIEKILDYSANINPFGLPESLKKSVAENFHVFEKYPDPEYVELREVLARHNGMEYDNIIVGNGATEIIFLYMKMLNPKKALVVNPTFVEYERALMQTACQVDHFQLKEEEGFILDKKRLREELKKGYDLLVICNPNNPTGRFIPRDEMEEVAIIARESGTSLMVDEAFIEFVEGNYNESIAHLKDPNIFVVRALTKFFAIPGIRLGFAICHNSDIMRKIQGKREPWTVNALAELTAKVVLDDREYIEKSENWIKTEKKWMYEELTKGSNIKTYKTETNFILVRLTGKSDSKILREKLIEDGILIRDCSNFPYLDEKYIRLAIKDHKNNQYVVERVVARTNENG
jgi:threonine-phosphate decarboxylase